MSKARIFINYRREDTNPYAHRIYDRLVEEFGADQLFFDRDTIPPGEDFVEFLEKKVASCDAMLAIIGPSWLTLTNESGRPRISDPDDFVVIEIVAALRRGVRVIPVLVNGAGMPEKNKLPESLQQFARPQACELPDRGFITHLNNLIPRLKEPAPPQSLVGAIASDARSSDRAPNETIIQIRQQLVAILSAKYQPLIKVKRSCGGLYSSADQSTKVVVAVSKQYAAGNYWYSYKKSGHDFLASAQRGLYVLGCVGRNEAFALPFDWIAERRDVLNRTENASGGFYHIHVRPDSAGNLFLHPNNGKAEPLREFVISLSARSAAASY